MKKKVLTVILSIAAMVGVGLILNANLLFPWQAKHRENKKAVLRYAQLNHPNAKLSKANYPSSNITNDPYDEFFFETDGIRFCILARDGKVGEHGDGYGMALLSKEVHEKYLDAFFIDRGLPNNAELTYYDYYPYWPGKDAEIKSFPGEISLSFVLEYKDDKSTPRDFGWFYDFYCYWKEVCPTKGFSIRFCCWTENGDTYQLYCYSTSEFDGEDEFYNSFKFIES